MFTSLLATVLLAASAAQSAPLSSSPPTLAPLYRRSTTTTNTTRYIVSIHPNTVEPSNRLTWLNALLPPTASAKVSAQSVGAPGDAGVVHHWDPSVFNGLAGHLDDASLAVLRAQSQVAYVEEDITLHKSASTSTSIKQTNAPWGLSRLSSTTALSVPPNFDPTNTTFPYTFPSTSGAGVDIYVVDSGVHVAHADFGGRATFLATFGTGARGDDRDGHGTHVAGTTAGGFFGVAKKASVFAVKVLDDTGAGPISDIISGLNVVAQRVAQQSAGGGGNTTTTTPTTTTTTTTTTGGAIVPPGGSVHKRVFVNANNFTLLNQLPTTNNRTNTNTNTTVSAPLTNVGGGNTNTNTTTTTTTGGTRPSVVNLSLGGTGHSNAMDAAVKSLVAQGIVMVIAAGNDGVDVADSSPADVQEAITVGAMDVHDAVPSFSDFGAKVDVFAPGADIVSCGITSNTASAVLSGTSMATPHITGLVALLLGEDPTLTPAQVKTKIQGLALRGALKRGFPTGTGTQNLLANNGL